MADPAPIKLVTEDQPQSTRHKAPRWPWLVAGLLVLLQGCATTPSVSLDDEARSQAKISYLLGDYQRTLAIVLPRAEAGEAWAQYTLGYMYYYGHGLAENRETAKRWIQSAAAKKYAPAQQALQRLSATSVKHPDENAKPVVPLAPGNGAASPSAGDNGGQTRPAMPAPSSTPIQPSPPAASTVEPMKPSTPPQSQTAPSSTTQSSQEAPATQPSTSP